MSVLIAPDTPYGKELWKWEHTQGETHPSDPSIRGMRPATRQAYPAMLYKALQKNPWKLDSVTVKDEREQADMERQGYVGGGPQAAADAYDSHQQAMALAAAHRNYEDRNMSAAAKAESNAVEEASARHVGEIPRTPIPAHRKRGRKPKAVADGA